MFFDEDVNVWVVFQCFGQLVQGFFVRGVNMGIVVWEEQFSVKRNIKFVVLVFYVKFVGGELFDNIIQVGLNVLYVIFFEVEYFFQFLNMDILVLKGVFYCGIVVFYGIEVVGFLVKFVFQFFEVFFVFVQILLLLGELLLQGYFFIGGGFVKFIVFFEDVVYMLKQVLIVVVQVFIGYNVFFQFKVGIMDFNFQLFGFFSEFVVFILQRICGLGFLFVEGFEFFYFLIFFFGYIVGQQCNK